MNTKGFFFTLIVIALISVFFITYEIYSYSRQDSVQNRISTMNSFLFSMENDFNRQVYITGFRTLFEIENTIAATGNYSSNLNARFGEAFLNGTLYGKPDALFVGTTFSDIVNAVNQNAKKLNVNVI